jgi:hypothetical protein
MISVPLSQDLSARIETWLLKVEQTGVISTQIAVLYQASNGAGNGADSFKRNRQLAHLFQIW